MLFYFRVNKLISCSFKERPTGSGAFFIFWHRMSFRAVLPGSCVYFSCCAGPGKLYAGQDFVLLRDDAFRPGLLCVDIGIAGIAFDEFPAGGYLVTHEHGKHTVGFGGIFDGYLAQRAEFGVHGGKP